MKRRDFEKLLRKCRTGSKLDPFKVLDLTQSTRLEMCLDLMTAREPIPMCLIPAILSWAHLTVRGYTRQYRTKEGTFLHVEDSPLSQPEV